jgi:type 1 glutamine amidotransferase
MSLRLLTTAFTMGALAWGSSSATAADKKDKDQAAGPFKVLVFSKTKGFRHDSIETGIEAVKKLGAQNGFGVDATEDSGQFTVEVLKNYKVVMFLNTTGDVLDDQQQKVFEEYIRSGNGWMGVHSASDTEYDWPFYAKLVGAHFAGHPAIQTAKLNVLDKKHPATMHLPDIWERKDEWYNFKKPPEGVNVLIKIDEKSYDAGGSANGDNHPMCWYHEIDAGRSFYTAGGHTKESYSEPEFVQHLLGGILYVSRVLDQPSKGKKKK